MRAWLWAVAAVLGFGLMLLAYTAQPRPDPRTPWASGLIAIGPSDSTEKRSTGEAVPTSLRLLPGNERSEAILLALSGAARDGAPGLQLQLRPKLILLSAARAGIDADWLQAGRLPAAYRDEVLAGPEVPHRDRLRIGDRMLEVVGVLKPDVALFTDCYLIPPSAPARDLFPEEDPSVRHATLIQLTPEQSRDRKILQQLERDYPSPTFTRVIPLARLGRGAYYLYLAGQAVLLIGGSGALIGLFRWAAGRVGPRWLAAPLEEMRRRPSLLWAVHLTYFGLVTLGAALIYELPEVQAALMSAVHAQLKGSGGPLGIAGKAYGSGSILRAAAVTWIINFLLGSVACITLPSVVLPGIGIVVAFVRALLWGLVLGPTSLMMAVAMLPHSGTLLLEGEGYILATFFGLLVPIHLLQSSLGGTALRRFGRVSLLNLQASGLVALVLAVAACYEAIEVIRMVG